MTDFRIGYGNDIHRLAADRKLILGGVTIPHTRGLQGHSDADVLIHAVIDAWLGALAMGDIGTHFPDTEQAYKDADSRKLLAAVRAMPASRSWQNSCGSCAESTGCAGSVFSTAIPTA